MGFSEEKALVRKYFDALEAATPEQVAGVLDEFYSSEHDWKSSYPFRELKGTAQVAQEFWVPLKEAITTMQRRQDIFIAGKNMFDENEVWVMSMGHFMGLFDTAWLGIKPTRRLVSLRYSEFNCVQDGKIVKTGLFFDLIGLMQQAGVNPLPQSTGQYFVYPGPRGHDALLFEDAPPEEGKITQEVVNSMINSCDTDYKSGFMGSPPIEQSLAPYWTPDMLWYGPAGVGATYTWERYRDQHQHPFRAHLKDRRIVSHLCRISEGNFSGFFGWPNQVNTPIGGFMGLPGGGQSVGMQIVDIYARRGDKLAENWVTIDLPWWLKQQGLDVLERNRQLNP